MGIRIIKYLAWVCLCLALFPEGISAQEKQGPAPVNKSELEKSKVGKLIAKTPLHLLDAVGEAFVEASLTSVPKYYLLYFSASW